jgi:CubicO group peptidase (beta-lactamase class C family)
VSDSVAIHGECDPRFAAVKEALAGNFAERGELGAAVTIALEGRVVVDLWGGWMDETRTRPWARDTLVDVFSVGKAVAATALLMLADRGLVDVDAPVARYWPAFAANGKDGATVRMLLAHEAGLPGFHDPQPDFIMYDWAQMTETLAAEAPWWAPGTHVGYHVNTYGFLVGELVRRASGLPFADFVAREITRPLGADFHFGIGAHDNARIADYIYSRELFASDPPETGGDDPERRRLWHAAYMNPSAFSGIGAVNTREWRAAVMPSAGGHANARAIARIYTELANGGGRLLSASMLDSATTEVAFGADLVLNRPSRFGLGFQLTQPQRQLGRGPRCFGHFGAGGSVGFADPDKGLAFAYAMNRSGPRWHNPRNAAVIDAAYATL